MKYIALITALLFLNHSSSAQKERLIDYFYSEDYQTKSFKWNIGVTETQILSKKENGLIVIGSVNTLPNGKRIINEGYYRPNSKEIIHTVGRTSVTNKLTRFDEPIIKYPKSNWETSESIYSCYYSSTKTDFNEYKKCIAVKENGKLIKGTTINYYAYGIGLVHVKVFGDNGKLIVERQLIDNEKKPTFEDVQNKIKLKRLRVKKYSLKENQPNVYLDFVKLYTDKLSKKFVGGSRRLLKSRKSYWKHEIKETETIAESPRIVFEKIINRVYSDVGPEVKNIKNSTVDKKVKSVFIDDAEFPLVCLKVEFQNDCLEMSTIVTIDDINISIRKGVTIIKKRKNGRIVFQENGLNPLLKKKITELLNIKESGKYLISYYIGSVGKKDISEIATEKI